MFFPIGDDNVKGGHKPLFSHALLVINILAGAYAFSLNNSQNEALVFFFGNIPVELWSGQDLFTLLTSLFLHGGLMHLAGNMLFLWIFADNVEAVIGTFNFMLFYLLGGVAATVAHGLFNPTSEMPVIGASGAISAVMGAYLVMFPASRIRVWIVFLFTTVYVPALMFLGFWMLQQTVAGVGSFSASGQQDNVAWWAHIGGFLFGVVAGVMARRKYRLRYRYLRPGQSPGEYL
ncbi:MAG: rhomboid family intramembrane serine protease [Saprospiraceae bacterium]|nr:rhomboid family intramembrane serine protease [Saprospiraceae bacterium]